MNRKRITMVAVAAIMGFMLVLWVATRRSDTTPKFRTAAIERGPIEALVSATGTIRPVVQVEVGSQVSGTVQKLFADYNSRVRDGQVLCQIEPSSFRARVVQAEAAVARAQAALKDARRQLKRANELFAQDYISKAEVEGADVGVEQRQADLQQARAQLTAARVDLANTVIRAPIDGVVIARSVDLGQTVAASLQAPKLFVIANDLTKMQVETRIDEADIGLIHPELPVRFTVDAFPDGSFKGAVSQVRLEPIVEQGVVTYTTVITTQNPELKLRPGMTANVSVQVAKREDALKVPNAALRFRPPAESKGRRDVAAGTARAETGTETSSRGFGGGPPGGGGRPNGPGGAGRRLRGRAGSDTGGESPERAALKPGQVYVLRDGKPVRVDLMTGLTDGAFVEVVSSQLRPGDRVIIGTEVSSRGSNLQPPPGMGGPGFGPGGGGRSRGGGR